jgi:hypothetical protein
MWRTANDRLLAQTKTHRERLLPFVTVEPAELELDELDSCRSARRVQAQFLRNRPTGVLDPACALRPSAWTAA